MIALDLAISLSSGLPWMGMEPPAKVRVGVVSREGLELKVTPENGEAKEKV